MASNRMPAGRTHPSRLARPPGLYKTGVIHMTLDPHESTSALRLGVRLWPWHRLAQKVL